MLIPMLARRSLPCVAPPAQIRSSAQQGDARAQYYLGTICERGLAGIAHDHAEALRWFRKAADNAQRQLNLSVMYDMGLGVPQNHNEAARRMLAAANQGLAEARLQDFQRSHSAL